MSSLSAVANKPVLRGVAVALVIGIVAFAAMFLKEPTYEGRIALLATPVTGVAGAPDVYADVVALSLPSISTVAQSPSVLDQVSRADSNSEMTVEEIRDAVLVTVIPASGLTEISVAAPTAELAGTLATSFAEAIMQADLLAPAGRLRPVGGRPSVTRAEGEIQNAAIVGVLAALFAAAGMLVWHRLFRPSDQVSVSQGLAAAGIRRPIVMLTGEPGALVPKIAALQRASSAPVRVIAVNGASAGHAAQLRDALEADEVPLVIDGSGGVDPAVVLVTNPAASPSEIAAIVSAAGAESSLLAVVTGSEEQ